MSGASFQYRLNITSPKAHALIPGNNSNHTFDSLRSGTSFNISIVTVGALGFESEAVQIRMVTTSEELNFFTWKYQKHDSVLLLCIYIRPIPSF